MWVDTKFISLVSPRLERFTRKSDTLYNFRCPFCGDSQKNQRKARGYLLAHKGDIFFKCHNCSLAFSFDSFLKQLDSGLYEQYRLEKFKESKETISPQTPKVKLSAPPMAIRFSPLTKLTKISSLHPEHPAKKYIEARKIPSNVHYKIFFTDDFQNWVNTFLPDKFPCPVKESRVVIPMLTDKKKFFGCVGRAIDKDNKARYYSIVINRDVPRVVGMDTVDLSQHIYVVEGAFDSFFLPNAIAMCGPDLVNLTLEKGTCTYIYDNQPRNKEVADRVEKAVEGGHKVFIWPPNLTQKDLNECVLAGKNQADLKLMIDINTFSGLEARLQFGRWKK